MTDTKRDVFDAAMSLIRSFEDTFLDHSSYHGSYTKTKYLCERYDAALPDDLPVIPKAVSEWLTWCKMKHHSLKDALDGETRVSEDVFARAWVLGVFRVEETGEIVKLEASK